MGRNEEKAAKHDKRQARERRPKTKKTKDIPVKSGLGKFAKERNKIPPSVAGGVNFQDRPLTEIGDLPKSSEDKRGKENKRAGRRRDQNVGGLRRASSQKIVGSEADISRGRKKKKKRKDGKEKKRSKHRKRGEIIKAEADPVTSSTQLSELIGILNHTTGKLLQAEGKKDTFNQPSNKVNLRESTKAQLTARQAAPMDIRGEKRENRKEKKERKRRKTKKKESSKLKTKSIEDLIKREKKRTKKMERKERKRSQRLMKEIMQKVIQPELRTESTQLDSEPRVTTMLRSIRKNVGNMKKIRDTRKKTEKPPKNKRTADSPTRSDKKRRRNDGRTKRRRSSTTASSSVSEPDSVMSKGDRSTKKKNRKLKRIVRKQERRTRKMERSKKRSEEREKKAIAKLSAERLAKEQTDLIDQKAANAIQEKNLLNRVTKQYNKLASQITVMEEQKRKKQQIYELTKLRPVKHAPNTKFSIFIPPDIIEPGDQVTLGRQIERSSAYAHIVRELMEQTRYKRLSQEWESHFDRLQTAITVGYDLSPQQESRIIKTLFEDFELTNRNCIQLLSKIEDLHLITPLDSYGCYAKLWLQWSKNKGVPVTAHNFSDIVKPCMINGKDPFSFKRHKE